MLSTDNAQIVRRDRALPGLAILLDPEAFADRLQANLPDTKITAAYLRYIRYKPGTNCLVSYQLETGNGTMGVYAKTYSRDAETKLAKAYNRKSRVNSAEHSYVILKDHAVVVSFFPNDAKIRRLHKVNDPQFLQELKENIVPGISGSQRTELRSIAYKPERRFVASLAIDGDTKALIKFHKIRDYRSVLSTIGAVESRNMLRVPRFLGSMQKYGIVGYEWLQGELLSEMIMSHKSIVPAVIETGSALAELHDQHPRGLAKRTRAAEAAAITALADRIDFLCPHLKARAQQLAANLRSWLLNESPRHGIIHGDFYAKQVLWTRGRVGIVDLDEAVMGDQRSDLGNFIAHLIRWRVDDETITNIQEALAVNLFQLIHHPFRICEPDWAEKIEMILDRVEEMIQRPFLKKNINGQNCAVLPRRISSPVSINDPLGAGQDPTMPFISQAMNPKVMEPALERLFFDGAPFGSKLHLRHVRVTRHKPGRRCLIEYDVLLSSPDRPEKQITLIGKARRKGLDLSTFHLNNVFYHSGFGADNRDGISVPKPVGVIPELNMWIQHKVPGTVLTELLPGSMGIALMKRAAEAAFKIHTSDIPALRYHTVADELRILRERLEGVARLMSEWSRRLEFIMDACRRCSTSVSSPAPLGIHRDFYPDQIIVDGSGLFIVDLDLHCAGDPSLDVGNFLGHITEQSIRMFGNPRALEERELAFKERYLELSGGTSGTAIDIYTTLTLARHISISTQFPERRPFTESLLELCEQRLNVQTSGSDRNLAFQ